MGIAIKVSVRAIHASGIVWVEAVGELPEVAEAVIITIGPWVGADLKRVQHANLGSISIESLSFQAEIVVTDGNERILIE